MKISLLQFNISRADPESNRKKIESMLPDGVDLLVLPEMFSTGFVTSPEGVAEEDGATLEWMKGIAERKDYAVAGVNRVGFDVTSDADDFRLI